MTFVEQLVSAASDHAPTEATTPPPSDRQLSQPQSPQSPQSPKSPSLTASPTSGNGSSHNLGASTADVDDYPVVSPALPFPQLAAFLAFTRCALAAARRRLDYTPPATSTSSPTAKGAVRCALDLAMCPYTYKTVAELESMLCLPEVRVVRRRKRQQRQQQQQNQTTANTLRYLAAARLLVPIGAVLFADDGPGAAFLSV